MRELPADRVGRFELTLPTAGARARLALQLSLLLAWVALVGCPAGGRNDLPSQVTAVLVNRIDRYRCSCVNDTESATKLEPCANHRHPAIYPHLPRLLVTIAQAERLLFATREVNIATTMDTDHSRKARSKTGTRNIAGKYLVDSSRQSCGQ